MELLQIGDEAKLERVVAEHPRSVRYLLGRLWDPDETLRGRAARALGAAAAAHPELGRELARRLLWALNDESATNGVYGLAALGEIGFRAPEVVAAFVGPISGYVWDDGLRLEILRALCRIAQVAPDLLEPHLEDLARHHDPNDIAETRLLAELAERVGEGYERN